MKWYLVIIRESGFKCTVNVPCSLMHCCRGIAIAVPISAPRLYSAWDHLIVFNFSHVQANLVLVNTATPAWLMCTDLQDWVLPGASALGGGCYSICASIGIWITAPFIIFFLSISFQDCCFFWDFLKKKKWISSYTKIRAVSGARKAFYKRCAALLLGTASHSNLQLES